MKGYIAAALAAAMGCALAFAGPQAAQAADDEARNVVLQLGMPGGALTMTPQELTLEKGKLYTLVLKNPSGLAHRLSTGSFAFGAETRDIAVEGGEAKGEWTVSWKGHKRIDRFRVREIDIAPDGAAQWAFVPKEVGTFHIECLVPQHAEAGMTADLTVL